MTSHAREFHRVLAAEVVSNFGAMLSGIAIPWLATLSLDASPLAMGALVVADVAAGAVAALVLGTLIDRAGKRAVMVLTDVLRAGVLALLAWLAYRDALAMWMLVAGAVASGALTVAFELARSVWIAERTEAGMLPTRNAQLAAGASIAETIAFALGGWLYQAAGAVIALIVDAVSYLLSALFLRGVAETQMPARDAKNAMTGGSVLRAFASDVRAGLAALAGSPVLRVLAMVEMLVAGALSLSGTSYMIYVARDIGFPTGVLGVIFALGGLGSVAGAFAAARLARRFGIPAALTSGLALAAIGAVCVALATAPTLAAVALLAAQQIVGDGGHTIYHVHDRTLRQTAVAAPLLARVDGAIRTLGYASTLAGALAGGWMATLLGARSGLIVAAVLLAIAAVVAAARLDQEHRSP
ncbi:MAG TPA: MFS transporter [Casimicrobiaceae bacterium]|nr:MFS transporter [Casimicrobiaceae bacterium]